MFLRLLMAVKGCSLLLCLFATHITLAGTLYLPLKLSPEIETRVERLFVLADMPIIKRPIAINDVLKALNKIEGQYPVLSQSIQFYLDRYDGNLRLTHSSVQYSTGDSDGSAHVLNNARGLDTNNRYVLSLQGYGIINDFLAVNAGIDYRRNRNGSQTDYEGTFLSFGWDSFQVDVGYRPHWLGPFQHSDVLLSTNTTTPLGVTVSNSEAFDFFNFKYEFALLELSESDQIQSINDPSQRLRGNPKLFVSHISVEPFDGFSLGLNRVAQYGGGDRKESPSDLIKSIINPATRDNVAGGTKAENDFGNQLSSVNARYISQGKLPYSVYMTYAGEDTSAASKIHLGNAALMLGLHLPKLPYHLDLTIESAQFQNAWYVNDNYGDGYRHEGNVLGHWAANFRPVGDATDMQSHLVALAWDNYSGLAFNGSIKHVKSLNLREARSDGTELSLGASIAYKESIIGLSFITGKNIEDENYSFISGSLRW